MSNLPKIVEPVFPEFLEKAQKMEGKTIKMVEYGYGEYVKDRHQTEILILEFTDGTKVGILIGSNAMEFSRDIDIERLKTDFIIRWYDEQEKEVI